MRGQPKSESAVPEQADAVEIPQRRVYIPFMGRSNLPSAIEPTRRYINTERKPMFEQRCIVSGPCSLVAYGQNVIGIDPEFLNHVSDQM